MMIRVDKHFIDELQKNGYDLDFKKITEIYRQSRNHPEIIKKQKKKFLEKGKNYKWVEEELEWIEISQQEADKLKKEWLEKKNI